MMNSPCACSQAMLRFNPVVRLRPSSRMYLILGLSGIRSAILSVPSSTIINSESTYVCDRKQESIEGMYCLRLYVGQMAVTLRAEVMLKRHSEGSSRKGTIGISLFPMDIDVMQWLLLCALTTMNFSASENVYCPALTAANPNSVSSRQLSSNL